MIEYGIAFAIKQDELHRGPMSLVEAEEWIGEFEHDGGKPGAFIIISRRIGPWSVLPRHRSPKPAKERTCHCGDTCPPGKCYNVPA